MIDKKLLTKIRQLDFEDRVELARTICDEIKAESTPLTKAQMAELQRRLDKYGDSTEGIPWEEIERELIEAERDDHPQTELPARSKARHQGHPRVVQERAKRQKRGVSKRA